MKRIMYALVILAAVSFAATPVFAQFSCGDYNAADFSPFAATWSGSTLEGGVQVPIVGTGTINFGQQGTVSMTYTTSINGVVYTKQKAAGYFNVKSDCTGSLTFTSGDLSGFTANFLVIFDGFVILGTDTRAGDTLNFQAFSILFGVQPNAAVAHRLLSEH